MLRLLSEIMLMICFRLAGVAPEPSTVAKDVKQALVAAASISLKAAAPARLLPYLLPLASLRTQLAAVQADLPVKALHLVTAVVPTFGVVVRQRIVAMAVKLTLDLVVMLLVLLEEQVLFSRLHLRLRHLLLLLLVELSRAVKLPLLLRLPHERHDD
jgi:hypothetical protein